MGMLLRTSTTGRPIFWSCSSRFVVRLDVPRFCRRRKLLNKCTGSWTPGTHTWSRYCTEQPRTRVCSCSAVREVVVDKNASITRRDSGQNNLPRWLLKIRQSPNVQALYNSLSRMPNICNGPVVHCGLVKLAHLIRYQGTNQSNRRAVKQLSKDLVLAAKLVVVQLSPRAAVDILWCSSYVPYKDPVLVHQLVCELSGTLHALPPTSLLKLITTLARVRYPVSRTLMDHFTNVVSPVISCLSQDQVAALLLACKKLEHSLPQAVIETCFQQISSKLHICKLSTLSVFLDSIPATNHPPQNWQQSFLLVTQSKLHHATPKELAGIASGLQKFNCTCTDAWLVEFLSECLEQLQLFSAPELVAVISGLAALCVKPDSTWLQAYLFQTKNRLPDFLASELASLVVSLARLGHKPSPAWLEAVCRQAETSLVFAGPEEAASLLLGLAKFGCEPEPTFVSRFLQHTRFKLCLLEGPQAVELFAALGGLRFPVSSPWCSELFFHTQGLIESMTPSMLAELVAGLAAWEVCPPPPWQRSLAKALSGHLARFRDPQRVSLITSLRKLSRLDKRLEPVLLQVVTELWEHTKPQIAYHMPSNGVLPSSKQATVKGTFDQQVGLETLHFGNMGLDQAMSTGSLSSCVLIQL